MNPHQNSIDEYIIKSNGSTVHEGEDGCANQHICPLAIYLIIFLIDI